MRDNRPFTAEEDRLIRSIYEDQNIKKWSMIARVLTEEYNFPRNAKQCRDRYHRNLDPMMISQWTMEEEAKLYELHDEIGNKWAVIAQKFAGRTDNCVKDHFYSKLRKSLRHLNKVIKQNFKKQFKELKIGSIYKIIQALEDRFNQNTEIEQEEFNTCIKLKRELLEYANKDEQEIGNDLERSRELISQIVNFSKNYKRKTKKQRRNSLNGAELFKNSVIQKRVKYSSDHESSNSEYSFVLSHKDLSEDDNKSDQSELKLGVIQEDIRESLNSKNYGSSLRGTQKLQFGDDAVRNSLRGSYKGSFQGSFKEDLNQLHKSQNINSHAQEILRQRGVLQEGRFFNGRLDLSNGSQSLQSDSQKQDMFDDNLRISEGLRNIEEMEEESHEESIFRSHR